MKKILKGICRGGHLNDSPLCFISGSVMLEKGPIGIFDSGVGGLSITRSIKHVLPSENIIYVADFRFSPYGEKAAGVIQDRSEYISGYLTERNCKALVVACNTATVNSIDMLRDRFDIPIVGVEPGIKPAVTQCRTGVIGVLATEQTLKSSSFQALKSRFSKQVHIECQACPEFVELVEAGNLSGEQCSKVVNECVLPLLSKGADHIVLGCTHFSFLIPIIEQTVVGKASIIDTAKPVALELKRRLTDLNLLNSDCETGEVKFCSTHTHRYISKNINQLLGYTVDVFENLKE